MESPGTVAGMRLERKRPDGLERKRGCVMDL
nr:MAG TPA: hypothetical protein [Caudoviricetes sp.]